MWRCREPQFINVHLGAVGARERLDLLVSKNRKGVGLSCHPLNDLGDLTIVNSHDVE